MNIHLGDNAMRLYRDMMHDCRRICRIAPRSRLCYLTMPPVGKKALSARTHQHLRSILILIPTSGRIYNLFPLLKCSSSRKRPLGSTRADEVKIELTDLRGPADRPENREEFASASTSLEFFSCLHVYMMINHHDRKNLCQYL